MEMRLFDIGHLLSERFTSIRSKLRNEHRRILIKKIKSESAAHLVSALAVFTVIAFVASEAYSGRITVGDLAMYLAAIQRGKGNLTGVLLGSASYYKNSLFLADLSDFLKLDVTVPESLNPTTVPRPLLTGVNIEHLCFKYSGSDEYVLHDINFVAKPGERIAIVGRNGSGKTTLVKLLCRFYDPTHGHILIDGIPVVKFSKRAWLDEISVFLQEHGKYYVSAHENISFGDLDAQLDPTRIINAAKQSGAHEIIQGLENKYETVLGNVFDQGAELSFGEWQKIALARTFLSNSQIVILDEPTNAMDALSEQVALADIWMKGESTITILISHRLSAVKQADRIYVLEGGRIVESGNHLELIQLKGQYHKLFTAQSKEYQ